MYVRAAFEAKSPPNRQDLVTLIHSSSLETKAMLRNDLLTAFAGKISKGPTNDIRRKIGLIFFIRYISHSPRGDK